MGSEQYLVLRVAGPDGDKWIVSKGDEAYGEYLDESSAVDDAVEAAREAGMAGIETSVVVERQGLRSVAWTSPGGMNLPPVPALA